MAFSVHRGQSTAHQKINGIKNGSVALLMKYNRLLYDLSGIWEMRVGPERNGEGWRPVAVPGTVNTIFPELVYCSDVLWYRRMIDLPNCPMGYEWRCVFKGSNYLTTVWADEILLGEHSGGYTEFSIEWPKAEEGSHLLEVRVDTALARTRVPHLDCDWFNYGGLYRPVYVELVPPVWIDSIQVLTPHVGDQFGLEVRVGLLNREGWGGTVSVEFELTGPGLTKPLRMVQTVTSPGGACLSMDLGTSHVHPWALGNPHVYRLRARLLRESKPGDEVRLSFGFRDVTVQGDQILVNGQPVRLLGVGKHDEHIQLGRTVGLAQYQKELELMREANINAFRTSHYAPSEEVVEMADHLGIGVILEGVPFFHTGYPKRDLYGQFSDTNMVIDGSRQLLEAVRTFFNHPSVIMWSIGNEMGTGSEGAEEFIGGRIAAVRQLDQSRPIGFSGIAVKPGRHEISERTVDLVDYIDVHLYAGWYDEGEYGTVEDSLELIDELHRRWPDKPILIGEFGADAIPGYRSVEHARWSEDYQALLLERLITEYAQRPFIAGMLIWHLYDFRTPPSRALRRAHEFNHKGILDENRRPKLAFDTVRRLYGKIASGDPL